METVLIFEELENDGLQTGKMKKERTKKIKEKQ